MRIPPPPGLQRHGGAHVGAVDVERARAVALPARAAFGAVVLHVAEPLRGVATVGQGAEPAVLLHAAQAAAELKEGERALELLCCTGEIRSYPAEWGERSVIILTKQKPTAKAYPRKAGTAEKKPL